MEPGERASAAIQAFQAQLDFYASLALLMLTAIGAMAVAFFTQRKVKSKKYLLHWGLQIGAAVPPVFLLYQGAATKEAIVRKLLISYKTNLDNSIEFLVQNSTAIFKGQLNYLLVGLLIALVACPVSIACTIPDK